MISTTINLSNTIQPRRISDTNNTFRVSNNNKTAQNLQQKRGNLTLNEGILQLSLTGSFMGFMNTGTIITGDNFEDYSEISGGLRNHMADIAKRMFFTSYQGEGEYTIRSIEEMTNLFEKRIEALRNATNISDERREIEKEALKRGFVMAAQMRFIGTTGESMVISSDRRFSTREAIKQFARNTTTQITQTGASKETQHLLFQSLSNIVERQSGIIYGNELEAEVTRFLRTRFTSPQQQEQAWQGVLEFQQFLDAKQQSFDALLVTLLQDINNALERGGS